MMRRKPRPSSELVAQVNAIVTKAMMINHRVLPKQDNEPNHLMGKSARARHLGLYLLAVEKGYCARPTAEMCGVSERTVIWANNAIEELRDSDSGFDDLVSRLGEQLDA